jgi:phosphoglycerol transferase MdoB-like AlkP superfamily enzyme
MVEKIKKQPLIPLFAGILILLHDVLLKSVTPPAFAGGSSRYLLYWLLVLVSSVGTNLLVLYVGYHMRVTDKPVRRLAQAGFYLVTLGLISVIWSSLAFGSFSARDFWIPWRPISTNQFPFATSLMIWYLLGPLLLELIQKLSQKQRFGLSFCLIWFGLILPFVFNQPLWGINSSYNFVWVGILFLLGQLLACGQLNWIKRLKITMPVMIVCLLLSLLVMRLNPITQPAADLTGRFSANYQLDLAVFSLALFGCLLSLLHRVRLQWAWPNWFAFLAYSVSCLSLVNYHLGKEFHLGTHPRNINWFGWIFIGAVSLIITVGVVTLLIGWLAQHTFLKRWIQYFTIDSILELPQFLKRLLQENWHVLVVVSVGFALTFIQFLVINLSTKALTWSLIQTIFGPLTNQLLLNIFIFIVIFLLFFSLVNRFWPALMFTSGLSLLIAISEYLKISLREEPILPTDLTALSAIHDIANMISPIIIVVAVVVLMILVVMSIVLQRHLGGMYPRHYWKLRVVTIIVSALFLGSMYWGNHANTFANIIFKAFNIEIEYYDQAGGAQRNGPIIQFMINLDTKIMDKPSGYSKAKIEALMKKYNRVALQVNQTRKHNLSNQTVLFVLSESFSDPNRVPNLKVSPNPMPYLTSLKKTTNSGLMLSQGYGGGTANMEWESLTGLSLSNLSPTLPTPYTQLVPSQKSSPAFTDLFDHKIAVHPFNASLYNRKQVFKKFGFQKFYYQGSKYRLSYQKKLGTSPYVSDASAYQDTLKVIKQNQKGSKFIQLSTMQNHMPFNNYYKNGKHFTISGSAYASSKAINVKTYAQGVNYTDQALKQFIKKIDQIKKPVTVVWYGDHLASLYTSKLMDQYPIQLHETDYFVYNNQSHQLSYTNRLVSPYSFPALALASNDTKVTPYYALLTKVTDDLPAMTIDPSGSTINEFNGSNIFVGQNGRKIKYSHLSKNQKQLYNDYKLIQYDLVAGKQYSAHWAEQKVKS